MSKDNRQSLFEKDLHLLTDLVVGEVLQDKTRPPELSDEAVEAAGRVVCQLLLDFHNASFALQSLAASKREALLK